MIRGLQMSKSGMITQQRKQENIANNIVNANTVGFKKATSAIASDKNLFIHRLNDELLRTSMGTVDKRPGVGPLGTSVFVDETKVSFFSGSLQETDNPLDLAIEGEGFFTVARDGQAFLTRDGVFAVDSNGDIVNSQGYFLMGQNGRINVGQGGDISVTTDGSIYRNNQLVDNLQISHVSNPNSLQKLGLNLFSVTDRTQFGQGEGRIRQGFLEGSNVDLAEEMVELISTMRAYEANQKMIQVQDETLGKAVNEIASVR